MAQSVEQIKTVEQTSQEFPPLEITPDSEGKMNTVRLDGDARFPSVDGHVESSQLDKGSAIAEGGLFGLSDSEVFSDKGITVENLAQESDLYKIARRFGKDAAESVAVLATPAGYVYKTSEKSSTALVHMNKSGASILGTAENPSGVLIPTEEDELLVVKREVADALVQNPENHDSIIEMMNELNVPYFNIETSQALADAMLIEADNRAKERNLKISETRSRRKAGKKTVQADQPGPVGESREQKNESQQDGRPEEEAKAVTPFDVRNGKRLKTTSEVVNEAAAGTTASAEEAPFDKDAPVVLEDWQRAIPTLADRRPREHGPKDNVSLRTEAMEEYQDKLDRERGFRIINNRKLGRAAVAASPETVIKMTENGVDLDTEQRPDEGRPETAESAADTEEIEPVIDPAIEAAEYKLMVLEETIKEIRRRKLREKWAVKYMIEYYEQLDKLKALRHETDEPEQDPEGGADTEPAVTEEMLATSEETSSDAPETEAAPAPKKLWDRMKDRTNDLLIKAGTQANAALFMLGNRIRKPDQKTGESEAEYNERLRKRGAVMTVALGVAATAAATWAITSGDNETTQTVINKPSTLDNAGSAGIELQDTTTSFAETLKGTEVGTIDPGEGLFDTFNQLGITDANEQYKLLHNNQMMLELRNEDFTYLGSDGWRIKMPEGGKTPDKVLQIIAKYTQPNQ